MHLLLRRSQRDDGWIWNSMTFLLDVRLELTTEERELFEKYDLRSFVVYDSDAFVQHTYSAIERYDAASKPMTPMPWEPSAGHLATAFGEIAASLWNTSVAASHEIVSMLALRITLGSLIDGQHFESQDLEELLTVEDNIEQATTYLANYLQVALTFDGREDLSEH
jgi:hypothetical protein